MTQRAIDPLRLPVASFAAEAGELSGEWAIAELPRVAESECPPDGAAADAQPSSARADADPGRRVRWHAAGSLRPVGGQHQIWLALQAQADVVLQCQRCLLPIDVNVQVDRAFRFVEDEATAAAIDDEVEEDVLVLTRTLDLRELVEDEMLLALPLVPRHEVCPEPLPRAFGDVEEVEAAEAAAHPFAGLAALRKGGAGGEDPDGE
jgi:uncharacterized protein